jgi:hypothetical protein
MNSPCTRFRLRSIDRYRRLSKVVACLEPSKIMLTLIQTQLLTLFLPVVWLLSSGTIAASPAAANCPGFGRPFDEVDGEVQQRWRQLKADPPQFLGKPPMFDTIQAGRMTLTTAFDRLTGPQKQQVLDALQLDGSTYTVYTADGRLLSAQYDGCTPRKALLTERDRFSWYFNRPPISAPLPMLREALRNPGQPRWRTVNHSIHPEAERRARLEFWQTVGYDKYSQGWWIGWVPEGGYFEVTVGKAEDRTRIRLYLQAAARQYRYVVIAQDGTPIEDTPGTRGNPYTK